MGNILGALDASSATPSTEVSSLHRRYPVSSVLLTSPPPRPTRIVPRGHPVGEPRFENLGLHRLGLPVFRCSPVRTCRRHYPGGTASACRSCRHTSRLDNTRDGSLLRGTVGSAPALGFSRPARRSLTLRPDRSPNHLCDPFIKDSGGFVASTAASIATGWNDPLPGGTDSH